jgi:hypothetical protein
MEGAGEYLEKVIRRLPKSKTPCTRIPLRASVYRPVRVGHRPASRQGEVRTMALGIYFAPTGMTAEKYDE